jgi:pSer/pThr/pTyr-binding forkhead associated (FHA) protein
MPALVVINGVATGTVFVLGDVPAVVGRSPEAHLRVGDPWISSMHAMFERRDDGLWVVDLESRNGVFVGEEKVAEARVPDGTVVRLGRTEIRFSAARALSEEIPRTPGDAPRAAPRRDTLRTDHETTAARRLAPRSPAADRHPLAEATATVLRIAVDAAGLQVKGSSRRLREALDAAAGAAAAEGATVARLAGVGVLAVFGLGGDGPDVLPRALAAARAAREAVQGGGGLALRAGIAAGRVLVGKVGAPGGTELAALGPAAVRAEQLLALAKPGEILAETGAGKEKGPRRAGSPRPAEGQLEVFRDEGP